MPATRFFNAFAENESISIKEIQKVAYLLEKFSASMESGNFDDRAVTNLRDSMMKETSNA